MTATWPDYYTSAFALQDVQDRIVNGTGGIACDGDSVCGTVAIAETSFGAIDDEGPWLISLCVAPAYRRRGIATALVRWAETTADARIYATTQNAKGLLQRRGWCALREVSDKTGQWTVMQAPPRA